MTDLVDRFGRVPTYLRESVTDRCNFRCVYCLPEDGAPQVPRKQILRYEEIERLVRIFAGLGIRKVRITGGEPTVRKDIETLVTKVAATDGIEEVALTTNGLSLAWFAPRLAAAGLRRVNVSLDTLDPERFAMLTRGGRLDRVLAGIEAARAAGLAPIKINAVLMEGVNDHEVVDLVEYFSPHAADTELRFIEYMPFDPEGTAPPTFSRLFRSVPARRVRERLGQRFTLVEGPPRGGADGPAVGWRIAETGLKVGFVSPLSEHFCASCNRLRLVADGHLRTCLAHEDTPNLRDLVRGGATDAQLASAIRAMVMGKPEGHDCQIDGGRPFAGVMTGVGG